MVVPLKVPGPAATRESKIHRQLIQQAPAGDAKVNSQVPFPCGSGRQVRKPAAGVLWLREEQLPWTRS